LGGQLSSAAGATNFVVGGAPGIAGGFGGGTVSAGASGFPQYNSIVGYHVAGAGSMGTTVTNPGGAPGGDCAYGTGGNGGNGSATTASAGSAGNGYGGGGGGGGAGTTSGNGGNGAAGTIIVEVYPSAE
jgi:hypothetical protein